MEQKNYFSVGNYFGIIFKVIVGALAIIYSIISLNQFKFSFYVNNYSVFSSLTVGLITLFTVLSIVFYYTDFKVIYKVSLILNIVILFISLGAYILDNFGLIDKFDSIDDLREFVSSFGNFAVIVFIVLQFLQVVILPIPAFLTVATGVLLFGAFKGSIYSIIGIVFGSIVAFIIGRFLGYKTVKWLVGKEKLDNWLSKIKGKDKIILTFMFLFPFFPDDVLCFIAGITSMSPTFFVFMIITTRIISIFASSYSLNNSIIPYNTWWGIMLWIIFIGLTVFLTILIYKKGDKIEKFFKKRKNKENKG